MKVLSTEGLTKLIDLIKSSFISNTDTETTSEVTLATVATTGAYSDLSGTPTVDQTYDGTSANAQSGVAVASAISGKADDSAVVHLAGTETITGEKTFTQHIYCDMEAPAIRMKNTAVVKGTPPSENQYWYVSAYENAGYGNNANRMGLLEFFYRTNGDMCARLSAFKPVNGQTSNSTLTITYPASGNPYCEFPQSPCVDGQWVYNYRLLANNVAANNTTPVTQYSLANYLPNDGYDYEVLMQGICNTGTTSGQFMSIVLQTDIYTGSIEICSIRTRSNSLVDTRGNGIVAVGTGRYVSHIPSSSNNYNGNYSLAATAYRRIGTNS